MPRCLSAAPTASPDAPAPTMTTSARDVVASPGEKKGRQHHMEHDGDDAAEPALPRASGHARDVARGHDERVEGAEADEDPAERRRAHAERRTGAPDGHDDGAHQGKDYQLSRQQEAIRNQVP